MSRFAPEHNTKFESGPLAGVYKLPSGAVQFFNHINSGVYPTEHHAVLAIRFVETQAELDRIRETQNSDTAHQIQVGLNLAECRRLAAQLTHAADDMEKRLRQQTKQ